jgi:hypothetical protein
MAGIQFLHLLHDLRLAGTEYVLEHRHMLFGKKPRLPGFLRDIEQ